MNYARITHAVVLLAATITPLAIADIYIEVDFAGSAPNAQTTGDLAIDDPTPLSIWIWADQPEVSIMDLSLQINGQSNLGIPNSGGNLTFDQTGTADPDGHFAFFATPGTLSQDNTLINNVGFSNAFFPSDSLPTTIENAWLLYTDFTATANDPASGVMPIVTFLGLLPGTPSQTIHTFGLYQTPTPSTLALLALAGTATTKRRR